MQPRILDMTFRYVDELVGIVQDASTPPPDHTYLMSALRILERAHDPRDALRLVPERAGLLEFTVRSASSGHRYGIMFIDMGHVADAVAYWRDPPRYVDSGTHIPHGYSRAHALALATRRLERAR